MPRSPIPFEQFNLDIIRAWNSQWFLLTAGENRPGGYNAMTVAWGSFGVVWGKPFAQIFVRPSRHTHLFTQRSDSFTLSAFPALYREALNLMGSRSGRDGDKIAAAGLTPIASTQVVAPGFEQAELIIECRKIYHDVLHPAHFLSEDIEGNYSGANYHTVYYGQILAILGIEKYARPSAGA
jgi:flavin reductase (DIM6/NTAB) family NADH-FMN oxidoreductase RutF